jgi:hypothetical protein
MEFKRLFSQFTYHIEAKPEGGFIARASDPTIPPLEAPTQMELRQKIQDNINAAIATQFPGLKLPPDKRISFHLERQSDGTVAFHSSDPNASATGVAPHEEVESHFAEKLFSVFGKQILNHLPPELSSQIPPELATQLSSGEIKVFVKGTGLQRTSNPPSQGGVPQSTDSSGSQFNGTISNSNFGINASDNSPITPARSNSGPIIRFFLTLLLLFCIMYIYLHWRR